MPDEPPVANAVKARLYWNDDDDLIAWNPSTDAEQVLEVDGGGALDFTYVHDQGTPANPWVITHNLGAFPNATVVDSSGRQVEGDLEYTDSNTITITFAGAFSGKAYLS